MNDIQVMIGEQYVVKKQISINQRIIGKGTTLFAWFCGQLVMLELNSDGTLNHAKAHATHPEIIQEKIRGGSLELMPREYNFEPGEFYNIDYGKFTKTACYLNKDAGMHYFFDSNGKFAFTDEYLEKGHLKFVKVENE